MPKAKKSDDTAIEKIEDETAAELEEVRETQPEVDLPGDAPGSESEDETTEDAQEESEAVLAKAGKRSAKSIREEKEETERQEAKATRVEADKLVDDAPKAPKRPAPNPLHQHGKKYREVAKLVEPGKPYTLAESLDLAKKTATTKFDSSVEMHINLGVDPRQADQMVRATVVLPHGTGKTIRVAVYADGPVAAAATEAGADLVGSAELLAAIQKGQLNFDLLITNPAGMAALGKVAKILGPRGLMPNPKSGTVTPDPASAVKDSKGGKVEFRIDKQAIIHQTIGKASFSEDKLEENAKTLISAILKAKPSAAKGTYVRGMAVTTSMGPGIKLDAHATVAAISQKK